MKPIEEENPLREVAKWTLMALQVLAMALCASVIAVMYWEDVSKLPYQMCVETPADNGAPAQ